MRINRQNALSRTASSKLTNARGGGDQKFSINPSKAGNTAGAIQGARPLAAIDALVSIQEVPDASTPTRRAIRHAEDVLDVLEEVQMGLVVGTLPTGQLNRLLGLIRREQEVVQDEKLASVLKDIELRAHVELAKLGKFA